MLGAIVGDIVGSVYEGSPIKTVEFPLFCEFSFTTDDTVLSLAVADVLLDESDEYPDRHDLYIDKLQDWFCAYPDAGYGGKFHEWADLRSRTPYGSWGNGSAMRVGPVGWAFPTLDRTVAEAKISAEVTHDHPEAIAGAQCVAGAVFLARTGQSKQSIRRFVEHMGSYDLSEPIDHLRSACSFDVSCAGTVRAAAIAFLAADDFESAVRLAVSLGGDSDTLAAIAGSIAEPFYGGVPGPIREAALARLDAVMTATIDRFAAAFA